MRIDPTFVSPPELIDLPRLRLRRPRLSDAAAIFEYASDPAVVRYVDWPVSRSLGEATERIRAREPAWSTGAEYYWVLAMPADDRAIGSIGCRVSGASAEFGFVLNRRCWGNGYATEAAQAVTNWVFSVPAVNRLSTTCDFENVASARVLEKAGLTREAILPRAIVRPNLATEPRDAFLYSKHRAL